MLTPSPTFIPRSWKAAAAARERKRQAWKEIPLIEPPWKRQAPSTQKLFLRDFNPGFRLLDATTLRARASLYASWGSLDLRWEKKIFMVRSFVPASLFPRVTRYFMSRFSIRRGESKHPYISIHLTAVDVASRAFFHNRVSHYPLSAPDSFL